MGNNWGGSLKSTGRVIAPLGAALGALTPATTNYVLPLAIAAGAAALLSPLLVVSGGRLRRRSATDEAYRAGLESLWKALDGETDTLGDPAFRITIFAQDAKDGTRLAPRLRMVAGNSRVLEPGDDGFKGTESFRIGEPFVGLAYKTQRGLYRSLTPLYKFVVPPGTAPKLSESVLENAWQHQWDMIPDSRREKRRSPYMHRVQTLWTFCVPPRKNATEAECVFSVDSVKEDAFPDTKSAGLLKLGQRKALEGAIAATVHAGLR